MAKQREAGGPEGQSYITEVDFPPEFPVYDYARRSLPEDSDPKNVPVIVKRPNLLRRAAEGIKNLSVREAIATGTLTSVALTGAFLLGQQSGVQPTERPPAAAPAVPGAEEKQPSDNTEVDKVEYELSDAELTRMNEVVKGSTLKQYEEAKSETTRQGALNQYNPTLFSYETPGGGNRMVSLEAKPTTFGTEITFSDSYTGSDGYKKRITVTFSTPEKNINDPANSVRNDSNLRITQYYETRQNNSESDEFVTFVYVDGNNVRTSDARYYKGEDGKGMVEYAPPKSEKDNKKSVEKIMGYTGSK